MKVVACTAKVEPVFKAGDLVYNGTEDTEYVFLLVKKGERFDTWDYIILSTGLYSANGNFTGYKLYPGTVTVSN